MAIEAPRIWLKAFWGFDPENEGYLGFTRLADRQHFLETARSRDKVLIYGATSDWTLREHRRQILGLLEVELEQTSAADRMTPEAWERRRSLGFEHRWSLGVFVRRAWRIERRIEIRHLAPVTYVPKNIRLIVSRGQLLAPEEVEAVLRLPVRATNVFGEPPLEVVQIAEMPFSRVFKPSRGLTPAFGRRQSNYEDGEHYLYILIADGPVEALLGEAAGDLIGKALLKIGYSNDPFRRRDDHNSALPPAGVLKWRLSVRSQPFVDGLSAKHAEDMLKKMLLTEGLISLGGEFFLGSIDCAERAFRSVPGVANHIRVPARRSGS